MNPTTQLFLDCIDDLRAKRDGTGYELLRASGVLRQLFLDQEPLVHRVNRALRIPLEFETIDTTIRPPIQPAVHWQNLDASAVPGARTQKLNLKGLLSAYLLSFSGVDHTVREVIKAAAHIKGGVHQRDPRDAKERNLLDLDDALEIGGVASSTVALRGIIQVSLHGLEPLVRAASQQATAADRPSADR